MKRYGEEEGVCMEMANGNIVASGNLYFRVFNLQLKIINKNFCYLYSVLIKLIKVTLPLVALYLLPNF